MRFFSSVFIGVIIMMIVGGCSTKQAETANLILPPPPDEPRLMFLSQHRGEIDYQEVNTLDMLIGEDAPSAGMNLVKPYSVAACGGLMYVTETAHKSVFVFDHNKSTVKPFGEGQLNIAMPAGVACDGNGTLYVSDAKERRVIGFDKNAKIVFVTDHTQPFERPTGVAVNPKLKRLYVVDTKSHAVKAYSTEDGHYLFSFGERGREDGQFNFPTNIAIDRRNGNIVVVDTQNFRVQVFDADGEFVYKFGKLGDRPGMFSRPKGVAVDSEGHVYVADAAFSNIQIFNDKAELLLFFGKKGKQKGQFTLIAGMYMDEDDRLYIVDSFNGRVQVFQYLSEEWKQKNPEAYQKLKE